MKFKILNVNTSYGRLGMITDVERLPSFTLETPNLLFYTKRGCVPHLTYDVMQKLTKDILPLQFPLNNIFHCCEIIEKTRSNLNSFVGLPEYFSYCFTQDPTETIPPGYHRGNTVTIWSAHGKVFVPKEKYMELMELLQPDMYCAMSDGDTGMESSMKRKCNSAFITNNSFEYCYNKHISSSLKNKGLIAPIEGGNDESLRERCAEHMSKYSVLGYLIDGLFTDGKKVNDIPFQDVRRIVQHTSKLLPEDRLRIVHGAWNPKSIIQMVKCGIDLFDTSFPYFVTENKCALVFDYEMENLLDNYDDLYSDSSVHFDTSISDQDTDNTEGSIKKVDNPLFIRLSDTKYFDDLNPILDNCSCLACKNYTKSYIHHLIVSKELLASVLLTLHNLHHYLQFFDRIRKSLKKSCVTNGF